VTGSTATKTIAAKNILRVCIAVRIFFGVIAPEPAQ
jgi:hypothetical protein